MLRFFSNGSRSFQKTRANHLTSPLLHAHFAAQNHKSALVANLSSHEIATNIPHSAQSFARSKIEHTHAVSICKRPIYVAIQHISHSASHKFTTPGLQILRRPYHPAQNRPSRDSRHCTLPHPRATHADFFYIHGIKFHFETATPLTCC
jgi:hypothetical protein